MVVLVWALYVDGRGTRLDNVLIEELMASVSLPCLGLGKLMV
jgi:hypothetical protein